MISVIVCSHNPQESYIARALSALRAQLLPSDKWELIVVDNASEPPLGNRVDVSWHQRGRVVREETLGLTPARLRGIREADGDVLVFVDDDNVLAGDYLEQVQQIADTRSFLGAWSGDVAAEFESEPPDWTRRYWGNLVIRTVTRDAWSNVYGLDTTTPLGAGLCVRRAVSAEYLRLHDSGVRTRLLDRAGSSLVSGGDNDLAACALDIGLGCGVIASLHMTHLIANGRLAEDYLLRLIESVAYSGVILKSLRSEMRDIPRDRGLAGRVADMLRRARLNSRERRFDSAVRRGVARARCELERV